MIGVLGGTFDPIHNGHLHIAKQVQQHFVFEKIYFIPATQSPHRAPPFASAQDRAHMVELAIQDNPLFQCNMCELNRAAPSYTIDTLIILKEQHDSPLALIIGSDAYAHFTKWHDWEKILTLATLIVVNRSDQPFPAMITDAEKTYFLNVEPSPISSSMIRERCVNRLSLEGFVPRAVEDYIFQKKLYNPTEGALGAFFHS